MIFTKTVRNFFWLLGSSIAIKGVGVLRESVVAYSIGNSLEFANFNSLRSIVDFVLAFVLGVPIIESILVPKYAPLYLQNNRLNFNGLWKQTKSLSVYILLIGLVLLSAYTYFKYGTLSGKNLSWILLFSVYLSLSLPNGILFSLQKVVGNFREYSSQSFYNAIITLTVIFVLINFIGLASILVASIIAITVSNILHKYTLRNNFEKSESLEGNSTIINLTEINLFKFISVNHAIFIGFAGRLIIGLDHSNQINIYQYSYIIISSFMLVIVSNISSIILYRSTTNSTNKLGKTILITLTITLAVNVTLYFFGSYLVALLYERGQYTSKDTLDTFNFLKIFLIPYSLFALSQVMIQPFLTKNHSNVNGNKYNPVIVVGGITIFSTVISLLLGYYWSDFTKAITFLLFFSSISITLYLGVKHLNFKLTN